MNDWVAIIPAVTAAVGGLAAGIKFIWDKIEKRFTAIEMELGACRERESAGQERRSILLTVTELLWQEISRVAPDSWALKRAGELMQEAKALDPKL